MFEPLLHRYLFYPPPLLPLPPALLYVLQPPPHEFHLDGELRLQHPRRDEDDVVPRLLPQPLLERGDAPPLHPLPAPPLALAGPLHGAVQELVALALHDDPPAAEEEVGLQEPVRVVLRVHVGVELALGLAQAELGRDGADVVVPELALQLRGEAEQAGDERAGGVR